MDKKALYILLRKYLNHDCDEHERNLVDEWLEMLHDDQIFISYTSENLHTIHNRIWTKIQAETQMEQEEAISKKSTKFGKLIKISKWLAAASIIGICVVTTFVLLKKTHNTVNSFSSIIPQSGFTKETNTTDKSLRIMLEDSSVIVLEPGTTVNYPIHFRPSLREVYLEGEAFFDISKNAKRPFFIYHNNLITHVIGTSFIINTKKTNKNAEISVITGRVEVSENNKLVNAQKNPKGTGVVLTPNQKVVYAEDTRTFVASIVEKPIPVKSKTAETFLFDNENIGKVLASISNTYAIEIVVENENTNNCTFTGNITNQDLYQKLDVICKSVNAIYEVKGTKILIKGTGCE
ncbi:MAG: FecR family protein [Deinococcales bacterium]|nr:FecR family protein [Chitinophagaceae bacterium]